MADTWARVALCFAPTAKEGSPLFSLLSMRRRRFAVLASFYFRQLPNFWIILIDQLILDAWPTHWHVHVVGMSWMRGLLSKLSE